MYDVLERFYSVYDSKVESYMRPFTAPNEASAVRSLSAAISDPNHDFNRFAEDFALFEVGIWDPAVGRISAYEAPKAIATCWSLKAALKERIS